LFVRIHANSVVALRILHYAVNLAVNMVTIIRVDHTNNSTNNFLLGSVTKKISYNVRHRYGILRTDTVTILMTPYQCVHTFLLISSWNRVNVYNTFFWGLSVGN